MDDAYTACDWIGKEHHQHFQRRGVESESENGVLGVRGLEEKRETWEWKERRKTLTLLETTFCDVMCRQQAIAIEWIVFMREIKVRFSPISASAHGGKAVLFMEWNYGRHVRSSTITQDYHPELLHLNFNILIIWIQSWTKLQHIQPLTYFT